MEKLFLLEVLVENVEIDYAKLDVDKKMLETAKQICITIQFLSFPELTICEEDFTPNANGDYQKSNINIKSGKSCLFSIRRWNGENRSMPLTVTVLRTNPAPPHVTVGKACINLGSSFTNILAAAQSTEQTETITKKCTDVYVLTSDSGTDIGKIRMFVRLTCFGPLIVTQFQISGDENNSYLFRGNDGSGIVTFNRNSSEELDKPMAPVHIPTKQIPCGELQQLKHPQESKRPGNCPPCPPCPPCPEEWNATNAIPGQGVPTTSGSKGMMPQSGHGISPPTGQGMMPGYGQQTMPQSGQGVMPQTEQGTMPQSGQGMMPQSGQGMMPGMGQGMMPQMGQGMMPQMGQGMMPQMGQRMMPGMGQGMMPQMGQGMMPGMGQGMMTGSGQGMVPWGEQMMPPGGQMMMPVLGSGMTSWGETAMMQDSGGSVTIMAAGGQGMMPESGFMGIPGGGQGVMPQIGQGIAPGGGQMMMSGEQGMIPGWGQGMTATGGQGMTATGGQGMMIPGGGKQMVPGREQMMMPGMGQMMPVGGQGVIVPGDEESTLDYKIFGAEVNGHSLSIKVLRKPRIPKKVPPPPPICGHIPIGKKSSSSSSEEEIPPPPPIQFCECDFPLPPGFTKNECTQEFSSRKKKKKKKSKDKNLKCPIQCSGGGDPFINYMNYQMLANPKTKEATDFMKTLQPVKKHIGILGDFPTNPKGEIKPQDEQVHTSGNPTFILNIPPKVFPVQDQTLETPFQSEQAKIKSKKLAESSTQYHENDGIAPEKQPTKGKDKKSPNMQGKGLQKKPKKPVKKK